MVGVNESSIPNNWYNHNMGASKKNIYQLEPLELSNRFIYSFVSFLLIKNKISDESGRTPNNDNNSVDDIPSLIDSEIPLFHLVFARSQFYYYYYYCFDKASSKLFSLLN
ncbi:hypothetical protein BLOT_013794 [Blomia tropicalis]|nr:hypothetical protein BLOT_013794 [Blomia tropicalis]